MVEGRLAYPRDNTTLPKKYVDDVPYRQNEATGINLASM